MRALWILVLCGTAHAQIEDEPTPSAVAPPVPSTVAPPVPTMMPPAAPSGVDVAVRFDNGTEIVGQLVSGDAETVTVLTRSGRAVTVPRNAVRELHLAVIPTPQARRDLLGARRFKHAGVGLLISGGVCVLLVPLLWAAAVPISNEQRYSGSPSNVILGAAAADVAFAAVGAQLLTMGGAFYAIGKNDEARLSPGLSVSY